MLKYTCMEPNNPNPVAQQPAPQIMAYQPAPAPQPQPKHKGNKLVPVVIFLLLAILGLGGYIIYDKIVATRTVDDSVETITTEIFDSLSSLDIPNENRDTHIAQALAGRLFTVNASSDQTIKFTSSEDYVYSYYRDPTADYRKILFSTHHGKFSVSGDTVRLESGDEFRIVGDYLVKSKDELSSNQYYVYFDNYQMYNVANGLNNSLNDYFGRMKKSNKYLPTTEKSHIDIDSVVCKADYTNPNITNADAYICSTYYTQYFNETNTASIVKEYNYPDFINYCWNDVNIQTYAKGGNCFPNSAIQNYASIIVRLTDNINYRVTGVYREDNSKMDITTGVDPDEDKTSNNQH